MWRLIAIPHTKFLSQNILNIVIDVQQIYRHFGLREVVPVFEISGRRRYSSQDVKSYLVSQFHWTNIMHTNNIIMQIIRSYNYIILISLAIISDIYLILQKIEVDQPWLSRTGEGRCYTKYLQKQFHPTIIFLRPILNTIFLNYLTAKYIFWIFCLKSIHFFKPELNRLLKMGTEIKEHIHPQSVCVCVCVWEKDLTIN